jgi:carbamoylphosphate synthase small subunit
MMLRIEAANAIAIGYKLQGRAVALVSCGTPTYTHTHGHHQRNNATTQHPTSQIHTDPQNHWTTTNTKDRHKNATCPTNAGR